MRGGGRERVRRGRRTWSARASPGRRGRRPRGAWPVSVAGVRETEGEGGERSGVARGGVCGTGVAARDERESCGAQRSSPGDVAFATAEDGPRSVRGGRSGEGAHRRSVHASRLAEAYGRPFGYQVLAAREATRKNGRKRAEGTRRCHRSSRRLFLTLKPERWLESRTVGSAGRPKRVSATPRISRRAR